MRGIGTSGVAVIYSEASNRKLSGAGVEMEAAFHATSGFLYKLLLDLCTCGMHTDTEDEQPTFRSHKWNGQKSKYQQFPKQEQRANIYPLQP